MPIYKGEPTKDGRKWYFSAYKDNIKYKSKKFLTKKEAEEEEALFKLKKDNPTKKRFRIVVLDFFKKLEIEKKESTLFNYLGAYNNHIAYFFDNMDISSINVVTIRNWAENEEKNGVSIKNINKTRYVLNKIFDFAIKNYGLNSNPSRTFGAIQEKNDKVVQDKDKLRYITLQDFNKFISCINDPLWNTFFTFAFYTGCRKGEIQALNWNDIDFENDQIIINKTLSVKSKQAYKITNTKTSTNRKIKMSKTLKECLMKYKNLVKKYTDYSDDWFVFGNTRFLAQTSIDRYKHHYFQLSGVKEITMHEFRHSHVSLLINEYIKSGQTDTAKFFVMMSNRMGHTIQVMQETYMHLFPSIQDEIVDLLDKL